jgi:beta-mannosidase
MRERVVLTRGWEYKEEGGDTWQPASEVPGSIHTDLLHNGQIPDPFVDLNELAVRWVAERDWWYRKTITADELLQVPRDSNPAGQRRVDLVFEGLDTFATVYLNNEKVLVTDNMFRSHRVDVTNLIGSGSGGSGEDPVELKIMFGSASKRGFELVKEHPEHNFLVRQTTAGRLPVRKAQYHWGWDWGPILTTAGIWRPVYLDHYTARLKDVFIPYELSTDLQKVSGEFRFKIEAASGDVYQDLQVRCTLHGPGGKDLVLDKCVQIHRDQRSETEEVSKGHIPFELDSPHLWHPHLYGKPNLYALKVRLLSKGQVIDVQTK